MRHALLNYDHNPPYDQTHHTMVDELELPCAPCHHQRHTNEGTTVEGPDQNPGG